MAVTDPTLARCRRCSSTLVYRDHDGLGCLACGYHTYERALESNRAPVAVTQYVAEVKVRIKEKEAETQQ